MRYFTDRPAERMMMQTPPVMRDSPPPRKPPKDHPCYGCRRYGEVCVLPCYRDVRKPPTGTGT